jgi:hypothetical protein
LDSSCPAAEGIAVARALIAGCAFEAFVFSEHSGADGRRVSMSVSPSAGGVGAKLSLQLR